MRAEALATARKEGNMTRTSYGTMELSARPFAITYVNVEEDPRTR